VFINVMLDSDSFAVRSRIPYMLPQQPRDRHEGKKGLRQHDLMLQIHIYLQYKFEALEIDIWHQWLR
jgi:hypothetical protein